MLVSFGVSYRIIHRGKGGRIGGLGRGLRRWLRFGARWREVVIRHGLVDAGVWADMSIRGVVGGPGGLAAGAGFELSTLGLQLTELLEIVLIHPVVPVLVTGELFKIADVFG